MKEIARKENWKLVEVLERILESYEKEKTYKTTYRVNIPMKGIRVLYKN